MAKIAKFLLATIKPILKIILWLFLLFVLGIIILGLILNSPENARLQEECMEKCLAQGISEKDCSFSVCS